MSSILGQAQLSTKKIVSVIGSEGELLRTARKRRPRAFQRRYRELMQKRHEETLTQGEYQELLSLTDEAEAFDTLRMKALAALAEIRKTDIDTLLRDIGLARRG